MIGQHIQNVYGGPMLFWRQSWQDLLQCQRPGLFHDLSSVANSHTFQFCLPILQGGPGDATFFFFIYKLLCQAPNSLEGFFLSCCCLTAHHRASRLRPFPIQEVQGHYNQAMPSSQAITSQRLCCLALCLSPVSPTTRFIFIRVLVQDGPQCHSTIWPQGEWKKFPVFFFPLYRRLQRPHQIVL